MNDKIRTLPRLLLDYKYIYIDFIALKSTKLFSFSSEEERTWLCKPRGEAHWFLWLKLLVKVQHPKRTNTMHSMAKRSREMHGVTCDGKFLSWGTAMIVRHCACKGMTSFESQYPLSLSPPLPLRLSPSYLPSLPRFKDTSSSLPIVTTLTLS